MANDEGTPERVEVLISLPEEMIEATRLIAEVTGVPADDHANTAAREYAASQMSDPSFNDRLSARQQEAQADIDRLLAAANPGL